MSFRTRALIFCTSVGLLLLVAAFFVSTGERPRQVVRVGLIQSTPFENLRINGVPSGWLVQVIEEAARRKGMAVDWVDGPEGGERSLEKGIADVWPQMAWMPSRDERFHITKAFIRRDFSLVSRFANPLRTPRQCARKRVSLVDGPFTRVLARKYLPDAEIVMKRSRREAIIALCRGEVEAAFSETSFFHELMMIRPPECGSIELTVNPVLGAVIEMGLGTLRSKAKLGETLRDAIDDMRADGTFTQLLAHSMPVSMSENEILFKEQQDRDRSFRMVAGASAAAVLIFVLLWHNRRVAMARKLTEQARAALESSMTGLRAAHQRLRFHVDRMPLACIVWNTDYTIREWNPASGKIFGWPASEAVGKSLKELLFPPGADAALAHLRMVLEQGDSERVQLENVSRDGRKLVCEWVSTALRDDRGSVTDILSLAQDVTDRTRLEEELRQAHKMESIGRLAGGVAHDFNNLLTVINGHCDLLQMEAGDGHPFSQSVAEIRKAGGRAASLTQQLLAFSRKQILQPKPLSLETEIREHAGMFQRMIGEDIELVLQVDAGVGRVFVDAGQIHRVIMNLLANARDAMPQGGKVTLDLSAVTLSAPDCVNRNGAVPGEFVVLAVTDTGSGMDDQTLAHIFEPFFTTKGRATATGLGLAMVQGIVGQSGGWIEVRSEVEKGATFSIFLPRLNEGRFRDSDGPASEEEALFRANETILLVEDEDSVRRIAGLVLKRCGYTVVEVADPSDAVAAARSHPGRIDLLLTDLVMPGMNGTEVAAAIQRIRPETAVLFMSGYGADILPRHGVNTGVTPLISKPFTPNELINRVRSALAASRTD